MTKVVQEAEDLPSIATVEDAAICLHGHLDAGGPRYLKGVLP